MYVNAWPSASDRLTFCCLQSERGIALLCPCDASPVAAAKSIVHLLGARNAAIIKPTLVNVIEIIRERQKFYTQRMR